MDCAVYYLAADKDEQVVRLAFSLATLREVYDGRVFVISDRGGQIDAAVKMFDVELIRAGYPEHIKQHVDRRFRSRWHKTQLLKCVRTKAGIFLDTDTLVLRDPQEGWDYLPPGKLFGIVCPNQQSIGAIKDDVENLQKRQGAYYREWRTTLRVVDPKAKHFNTGVMYWRQSAYVSKLFATWHSEWNKFTQIDQLAFARAIHTISPEYVELPGRFNQLRPKQISDDLVVFHGTKDHWRRVSTIRPEAFKQGMAMVEKAGLKTIW